MAYLTTVYLDQNSIGKKVYTAVNLKVLAFDKPI